MQFVERHEGFYNLAPGLRSKERQETQAQMSTITKFLDVINSNIIVTPINFFIGFYKSFFKQHYDILKSIDKITKTTCCMSCSMACEAFSTYDEL